jgi:hypothetical protein
MRAKTINEIKMTGNVFGSLGVGNIEVHPAWDELRTKTDPHSFDDVTTWDNAYGFIFSIEPRKAEYLNSLPDILSSMMKCQAENIRVRSKTFTTVAMDARVDKALNDSSQTKMISISVNLPDNTMLRIKGKSNDDIGLASLVLNKYDNSFRVEVIAIKGPRK